MVALWSVVVKQRTFLQWHAICLCCAYMLSICHMCRYMRSAEREGKYCAYVLYSESMSYDICCVGMDCAYMSGVGQPNGEQK